MENNNKITAAAAATDTAFQRYILFINQLQKVESCNSLPALTAVVGKHQSV